MSPAPLELGQNIRLLSLSNKRLMHSGTKFVCDSGRKQKIQRTRNGLMAPGALGNSFIPLIQRSFDIQPNPVDQGENLSQPIRENASSMKPDQITHPLRLLYRFNNCWLPGWFAAAEDDGLQKSAPFLKELLHVDPLPFGLLNPIGLQMRVVTISALPPAALAKYHRAQLAWKIHRRKRDKPADLKVIFFHG